MAIANQNTIKNVNANQTTRKLDCSRVCQIESHQSTDLNEMTYLTMASS